MQLDLASLRALYKSGAATPSDVVAAVYDQIVAAGESPVWISTLPREKALAKARTLEQAPTADAFANSPGALVSAGQRLITLRQEA